jgi:hypothetical protein
MKLGAGPNPLRLKQDVPALCAWLRAHGFDSIDLQAPTSEAVDLCRADGLQPGSFDLPGIPAVSSPDPGKRRGAAAALGLTAWFACFAPEDRSSHPRRELRVLGRRLPRRRRTRRQLRHPHCHGRLARAGATVPHIRLHARNVARDVRGGRHRCAGPLLRSLPPRPPRLRSQHLALQQELPALEEEPRQKVPHLLQAYRLTPRPWSARQAGPRCLWPAGNLSSPAPVARPCRIRTRRWACQLADPATLLVP